MTIVVGALDGLVAGRPSSPRVEKYGEKKNTCSSRSSSSASANCAELLADVVELVLLLGDLEQRARVDLGDLLHRASSRRSSPASCVEVELAERLLDQAALVVVGQRLAGDLLGRQHREVGDLARGSPGSRGASRPRCRGGSAPAAPRAAARACVERLALVASAGLARAGDDLLGLARAPR